MSFRLIPTKTLFRACADLSRNTQTMKKVYILRQHAYMRPTYQNLCYTQSRGIFWGEKKPGQEQETTTNKAETTQEKETTNQAKDNVNEAKNKETSTQKETRQEETQKKTQESAETKTAQKQESKPKQEAPETFQSLLEDLAPENRRKLQNLWAKLEKEVSDKAKQATDLKATVSGLETAANNHKTKLDELRNRLKEEIEERELMRKRFDKELDQAKSYAITKFAKDLIEVPDNLGRALDAAKNLEGKGDNLYEGVKATNNILLKTFARHGITQVSPIGEKFDPNFHEALFDFEDPNQRPGTCGYVANTGYIIGDRVLRPAKVGVVKGIYQEVSEEKKE